MKHWFKHDVYLFVRSLNKKCFLIYKACFNENTVLTNGVLLFGFQCFNVFPCHTRFLLGRLILRWIFAGTSLIAIFYRDDMREALRISLGNFSTLFINKNECVFPHPVFSVLMMKRKLLGKSIICVHTLCITILPLKF